MPRCLLGLLVLFLATPLAAQDRLPVHVGGRVVEAPGGALTFGWPGIYFESRFRGTGFSVAVASDTEIFRLTVDGSERAVLNRPDGAPVAVTDLAPGEHVVRLEKLTESQTGGGRFLGFRAEPGTEPLEPVRRARQIEFVGDSYSVGYGNSAPGRTCTRREVHDTTDTSRAFGPLLARRLDADYRVNAFSGFGIVRNYAGGSPDFNLPAIYERLIPGDLGPVETAGGDSWRPQLIVINLGGNDFSTPLHPGERWPDAAALRTDYRAHYVQFARALMARQPQARLVLMGSDNFVDQVEQVAAELNRGGGRPVTVVRYGGLANTGCDWHPDLADHRVLADLLERTIAGMDGLWD